MMSIFHECIRLNVSLCKCATSKESCVCLADFGLYWHRVFWYPSIRFPFICVLRRLPMHCGGRPEDQCSVWCIWCPAPRFTCTLLTHIHTYNSYTSLQPVNPQNGLSRDGLNCAAHFHLYVYVGGYRCFKLNHFNVQQQTNTKYRFKLNTKKQTLKPLSQTMGPQTLNEHTTDKHCFPACSKAPRALPVSFGYEIDFRSIRERKCS